MANLQYSEKSINLQKLLFTMKFVGTISMLLALSIIISTSEARSCHNDLVACADRVWSSGNYATDFQTRSSSKNVMASRTVQLPSSLFTFSLQQSQCRSCCCCRRHCCCCCFPCCCCTVVAVVVAAAAAVAVAAAVVIIIVAIVVLYSCDFLWRT